AISAGSWSHAQISQYTPISRMRRAISCVYCAPKSRMRILSLWMFCMTCLLCWCAVLPLPVVKKNSPAIYSSASFSFRSAALDSTEMFTRNLTQERIDRIDYFLRTVVTNALKCIGGFVVETDLFNGQITTVVHENNH